MQVNATVVEGLRREFQVVVPATELDGRLATRLNQLKDEVRIKGFRPGKVPVSHLRRLYGRSTMAEIVQSVINEVARDTLADRGERAALQPDFKLPEDEGAAEKILTGEADLTYTMTYEVLPKVELADFDSIAIERPVAEMSETEVDDEIDKARRERPHLLGKGRQGRRPATASPSPMSARSTASRSRAARDENAMVRLGTSQFIPGFAEQLERPGRRRPEDDHRHLPGGLRRAASRRQGGDLRRHREGSGGARSDRRSTMSSPSGSASNCSTSSATPSASRSRPATVCRRGRRSSASSSTSSTRCTASTCRRRWSSRSSTTSGARSSARWARPGAPSRARTPPRRRRARNIARSPSAGCGSGWCFPRSASGTRSR